MTELADKVTANEASEAESSIIRAAQAGDARAFEQIDRRYAGQVYGLCLRMVGDVTTAETLTQDVFVRAWGKLGSFEGRGAFGGWLRRLAANQVIEDRRRLARTRRWVDSNAEVETMDQGRTAATRAPNALSPVGGAVVRPRETEIAIDLERAIATLPPGARQVFVLHDISGYRYREIAEMLDVALGTVKAHLHRARSLLRKELQRSEEAVRP